MRVIAGSARGRALKAPNVPGLRPTSDLVRGAIFDIIGPYFSSEERVLDLYAGTGALGIEALSRGAGRAEFVEQNARCCAAIRENLQQTGFTDRGELFCLPVRQAVAALRGPYSLVLMDPPYAQEPEAALLDALAANGALAAGALLVVEHSRRMPVGQQLGPFVLAKRRRHGDTVISVFELPEELNTGADVGQSGLSG